MINRFEKLLELSIERPLLSIVLGSGFDLVESQQIHYLGSIKFEDAGFKIKSVIEGHRYEISLIEIANKPVLVFHGRLHLYEGYTQREIVFPVELTDKAKIKKLLLTSASGGISDHVSTGEIVRVSDHINLSGGNPLTECIDRSHFRNEFLDLSRVYKNSLNESVISALKRAIGRYKEGVLATVPGPVYETPAEARFLKIIGADMVSMSTAPEAIFSHYLGIETAAVVAISNHHFLEKHEPLNHEKVLDGIRSINKKFNHFLLELVNLI